MLWAIVAVTLRAPAAVREDTETLLHNATDRSAGTPGAQASADYLAARLQQITGEQVLRQKFLLVVPVVEYCRAYEPADGGQQRPVPLAPLSPSGGQAAAIREADATAPIVYAGKGTLAELDGKVLANSYVALEINSGGSAWQTIAGLGARGIIFIGSDKTRVVELLDKSTTTPVSIPRFFCDDPAAVARIKSGEMHQLTIEVKISWQEREVENLLCLIPGRQKTADLAKVKDRNWFNQMVVVQTRYDGVSEVMGRAPGATQALNAGAALRIAEFLASAPDRQTTLIALTAGDEWNNRGTRQLYDILGRTYGDPARYDTELTGQVAEITLARDKAKEIVEGLQRLSSGDQAALNSAAVTLATRDQMARETSLIEDQLQQARLRRGSPVDAADETASKLLVEALEKQKRDMLATDFNLQNHVPLPEQFRGLVSSAAVRVLPIWQTELARQTRESDELQGWQDIRKALGPRFPLIHFTLALSSGSTQFGFLTRSYYHFLSSDITGRMAPFAREFRRYDEMLKQSAQANNRASAFVADTMENRFTVESFFSMKLGFSSDAAIYHGQPAGAFATVHDATGLVDTPQDTLEHLDWFNFDQQMQDLTGLLFGAAGLPGALTDPLFYGRTQISMRTSDQRLTVFERTLGETIPRLGAPNVLVGTECEWWGWALGWPLAGTRRTEWYLTNADGTLNIHAVPKIDGGRVRMQAFAFDADGLPTRCLMANGSEATGLAADFAPDAWHPVRAMLFDCKRLDAYGLFDPRYMEDLSKLEILDARRLDKAQFSYIWARSGTAAIFMPRDITWQLLVAKGSVANRMLLINLDDEAIKEKKLEGRGFQTTDLAKIGPLVYRNVQDLYQLNRKRQRDLERFGISNEVIKDLQARSAAQLKEAEAARTGNHYLQWFAAADAAWSYQSQVYQNLISTSNGIIKGVIFLLLGIIPFSYFLERLIIGATNVYKQIGWFAAIFAFMTAALWFHPAFRISSAPLMILLAFLILILSSTVVYILFGKFEEEISRLRGAASAAHSANLKRGAVLGAAVRLGLSNMRRRGTRTTLTLITLVLLTFTLLCFTSVRESVQITPRIVASAPDNMPAGIQIRMRAWRALSGMALHTAAELAVSPDGTTLGPVAQRWWYASDKAEQPWYLPVRPESAIPNEPASTSTSPATLTTPATATAQNPNASTFFASGFVGIDPAEQNFQRADMEQVLPGFSRLAAGENLCWLPDSLHETMNLRVGETVDILGYRLTIAGFFTDEGLLSLRNLTGDEMTPTDPTGAPVSAGTTSSTAPEDVAATPEATYRFLNVRSVAVLPRKVVQDLGGRMTSIMVRPAGIDADALKKVAEDLARRSVFAVYVSDGKQVRTINAIEATRPQDLDAVLVPMLIAGVIVLNTMLGAVAERTREIHVYTSVGLAPSHVGMLFLAEAAALGTLGVVFGYIFGQGLATVLSWAHLMGGTDLNYSSMSAIVTMGLVLAIVMASSLWPARAATRVATPSLKRDWKLPKPEGDTLRVELPFTVNETAARGVCAFLQEFLITTSQAGTGRFTADHIKAFVDQTPEGPLRGLACRVWLAPYDLGVIQALWLGIYPTSEKNVFEVKLMLVREAGSPTTWYRLNRPFLVEVRKQFLLWRAVPPILVKEYLDKSESMFAAEHTA